MFNIAVRYEKSITKFNGSSFNLLILKLELSTAQKKNKKNNRYTEENIFLKSIHKQLLKSKTDEDCFVSLYTQQSFQNFPVSSLVSLGATDTKYNQGRIYCNILFVAFRVMTCRFIQFIQPNLFCFFFSPDYIKAKWMQIIHKCRLYTPVYSICKRQKSDMLLINTSTEIFGQH